MDVTSQSYKNFFSLPSHSSSPCILYLKLLKGEKNWNLNSKSIKLAVDSLFHFVTAPNGSDFTVELFEKITSTVFSSRRTISTCFQ